MRTSSNRPINDSNSRNPSSSARPRHLTYTSHVSYSYLRTRYTSQQIPNTYASKAALNTNSIVSAPYIRVSTRTTFSSPNRARESPAYRGFCTILRGWRHKAKGRTFLYRVFKGNLKSLLRCQTWQLEIKFRGYFYNTLFPFERLTSIAYRELFRIDNFIGAQAPLPRLFGIYDTNSPLFSLPSSSLFVFRLYHRARFVI